MADNDVLPVGRFQPSTGLTVDRSGTSVSIRGQMELSGSEASVARAALIQQSINATWTHTFKDGFEIDCDIHVRYRGPGTSAGLATQITAEKIAGPSHVSPGLGSRSMTLNANEPDAFTWTPTHEFGHILGLQDRYSESIMSKIRSTWGGSRNTWVQAGYEGNIMSTSGGPLESKNVADIAAENEPSAYWTNDDDYVRSWIENHPVAPDIARLSTAEKLRAIWILQGGWISGEDLAAMGKICSAVTSHGEAEAIRRGVNVLIFTDLGQRTKMRVYLAKMP
jgi:hypothetical protein